MLEETYACRLLLAAGIRCCSSGVEWNFCSILRQWKSSHVCANARWQERAWLVLLQPLRSVHKLLV